VRVWKGEEDWVFGCNTKLKKKKNLDSVDYTQYFHGMGSEVAYLRCMM
jgi:hypothetical protein